MFFLLPLSTLIYTKKACYLLGLQIMSFLLMIYGPLLSNGFEGFQSTVSYIYDENWRPECFEQKVWHAKGPKAEELDMFGELTV